jgi:hypothetical protein
MHLRTDLCLATVLVAAAMGCDEPFAENSGFGSEGPSADATHEADAPQRAVSLEYEDQEDFAIINDRSNLRRSDMTPLEHRRSLDLRFRDELLAQMDGVTFPTDEEIASVSMRWFATGRGIVVENPTERPFTASAYFSATAEPACGATVSLRAVAAGGSAMLSPPEATECAIDRADVTLTDEYGLFVNLITVEGGERKP